MELIIIFELLISLIILVLPPSVTVMFKIVHMLFIFPGLFDGCRDSSSGFRPQTNPRCLRCADHTNSSWSRSVFHLITVAETWCQCCWSACSSTPTMTVISNTAVVWILSGRGCFFYIKTKNLNILSADLHFMIIEQMRYILLFNFNSIKQHTIVNIHACKGSF